jgi:hypothetical protein
MPGFGDGYMGLSLKPEDHPDFVPVPLETYIEYAQQVEAQEAADTDVPT